MSGRSCSRSCTAVGSGFTNTLSTHSSAAKLPARRSSGIRGRLTPLFTCVSALTETTSTSPSPRATAGGGCAPGERCRSSRGSARRSFGPPPARPGGRGRVSQSSVRLCGFGAPPRLIRGVPSRGAERFRARRGPWPRRAAAGVPTDYRTQGAETRRLNPEAGMRNSAGFCSVSDNAFRGPRERRASPPHDDHQRRDPRPGAPP